MNGHMYKMLAVRTLKPLTKIESRAAYCVWTGGRADPELLCEVRMTLPTVACAVRDETAEEGHGWERDGG